MSDTLAERQQLVPRLPLRPWSLLATALTSVLLTLSLWGLAAAINAMVGIVYFTGTAPPKAIETWQLPLTRGVLEGLYWSIGLAIAFAAACVLITRVSCTYRFALRHLLVVGVGSCTGYVFGGLFGVLLASSSPQLMHQFSSALPADRFVERSFGWVIGSNVGLPVGCAIAVVLSLVIVLESWRRIATSPKALIPYAS